MFCLITLLIVTNLSKLNDSALHKALAGIWLYHRISLDFISLSLFIPNTSGISFYHLHYTHRKLLYHSYDTKDWKARYTIGVSSDLSPISNIGSFNPILAIKSSRQVHSRHSVTLTSKSKFFCLHSYTLDISLDLYLISHWGNLILFKLPSHLDENFPRLIRVLNYFRLKVT